MYRIQGLLKKIKKEWLVRNLICLKWQHLNRFKKKKNESHHIKSPKKKLLYYNVMWSPCALRKYLHCEIIHWWIRDLMFGNGKKKRKKSSLLQLSFAINYTWITLMTFQNMMHQVSTCQVSQVLPQCTFVREAGLFQSVWASFSTLKWQFIK